MFVLFSDLDGTLLDGTYSFAAAEEAVAAVRKRGIPLVFCTSKTRAEVERWRGVLGNRHPFIVENGAAVFIPEEYFPFPCFPTRIAGGYQVIEFGAPYGEVLEALRRASEASNCRVRGFHQLSTAELAALTGLPDGLAELARRREYDEPFEILDDGGRASDLLRAIEGQGMRWTGGGRYLHITGDNDKGLAVRSLAALFRRALGDQTVSVGLGDGPNDATMLGEVDRAFIVRSRHAEELRRLVPSAEVTQLEGPAGWNEAVQGLLGRCPPVPMG